MQMHVDLGGATKAPVVTGARYRNAVGVLAQMMVLNGPYECDWCADCLRNRKHLLRRIGAPTFAVVLVRDDESAQWHKVGDLVSLLSGVAAVRAAE